MTTFNPNRRFAFAALAAGAAVLALPASSSLAWGTESIKGSGVLKKETRNPGPFRGVAFALAGQLEVRIGNTEAVTIEADDNVLRLIETVVENGTLEIRAAKRSLNLQNVTIRIVVQARDIDHLSVGGAGTIDAQALRAKAFQANIGGSGSINLRGIEADSLSTSIGGSGDLKAAGGTVRKISVSIGGSGSVQLEKVKAVEAGVNVAGSGDVVLNVTDNLNVSIAGSGGVSYYGDPKVSRTVVGSGGVRRLGGAR
ncbi:MAG: head GIN domain-containing protein [Gammaproteobacteria bacterium]